MKISKLFHWLYFIVMMLPIMALPIFAIYSHRHDINNYSVDVPEQEVITYNQLNEGYDTAGKFLGSGFTFIKSYFDNGCRYTSNTSCDSGTKQVYYRDSNSNLDMVLNHVYVSRFYVLANVSNTYNCRVYPYLLTNNVGIIADVPTQINVRFSVNSNTTVEVGSVFEFAIEEGFYIELSKFQLFDLTLMFGSGNEPSLDVFNTMFPNDYYDYTLGSKILVNTGSITTYNQTDIGSQFLYVSYNYVDQYFNYDNVFNFGTLYSWLELNFFTGNAPLGFFIFWHLLIYWLLTSLLWLLFDVLMYVPQLIHRWLDKASLS